MIRRREVKRMKKLYLTALNFFITVLFCSSVSYAAPWELHMDLSKTHVLPGETFTVDLYLTDVPGDGVTFGLSAYSHDLLVQDLLDVVAVRVDSAGDFPNSNLEVGKVNASDFLLSGFWSGPHVDLFEVDLKFEEPAMLGTIATLGQSWHHVFGENFAGKAVSDGPSTTFDQLIQFIPSSAEATLVPIPSTLLLLGSGVLGVIAVRRRMRG
jgi:hypothetical protein